MAYQRAPRTNYPIDDYRLRPRTDRTYSQRPDGNIYNRASYNPANRQSGTYSSNAGPQFNAKRKLPMPPPPSPPVPTARQPQQFTYYSHPMQVYEAEMQARFSNIHMNTAEDYYYDDVVYECPRDLNHDCYETIATARHDDESESEYHYDKNRFLYEDPKSEIDLLLIGKTGHGKSALGNSILGRYVFESHPSCTSVTKSVKEEVVEYKGKVIKVVDGPGVADTELTDEDARDMIIKSLSGAISINLRGYHAFLLVLKFGDRFTKENQLTISVLKKVLGESFVKKFCILVMTHGDQFECTFSFRDWLDKERGDLVDLVRECDNRIILYDNKAKESGKREGQLDALLEMVQMLVLKNGRYTNEQFELENVSREALMLEPKKVIIQEESMKEASLILEKLRSVQSDTKNILNQINFEALHHLSCRTHTLLNKLKEQDKNTGVLKDLITHVQSLLNSIDDEYRLMDRITQMLEKVSVDGQLELIEHIRRQREEFYLSHVEGKGQEITEHQSDLSQPPELKEEIYTMKKHWTHTILLNSQLNEIKKKKKKTFLKTFQNKVLAALRINLKENNKNVDVADESTKTHL